MLRNINELQARFPQGPKAGITQETSKYGIEQLRGQWGERVPKVVSAPRRAPLGTGCLFQGELEERRAEAGNFEGQRGEAPNGEPVRDGWEILLGGHGRHE